MSSGQNETMTNATTRSPKLTSIPYDEKTGMVVLLTEASTFNVEEVDEIHPIKQLDKKNLKYV